MTPHEFMLKHTDYTVVRYQSQNLQVIMTSREVEALFKIPLEDIPKALVLARSPDCDNLAVPLGLESCASFINPEYGDRFLHILEKRLEVGV